MKMASIESANRHFSERAIVAQRFERLAVQYAATGDPSSASLCHLGADFGIPMVAEWHCRHKMDDKGRH